MFNNNCNDTFSDVIALAIIAMLFGWGGFGGFGGGQVMNGYTLGSDFSTLQRIIDSGFSEQRGQGIQIANGIASLGYDQLAQMNGINTNIMQGNNALQAQFAQCCCDNKMAIADLNYNLATQACATNTNIANSTRDIIDAIKQQSIEAKDERIAEQAQQISALQLAASQTAQNAYLISQLRPQPVPSFPAQNLYGYYGYGTTIA